MQLKFWHERWHNQQLGFHLDEVNPLLVKHWPGLQLETDSWVFVPLAGKSKDMTWLSECGHQVLGNEISPIAVAAYFQERGIKPKQHMNGLFLVSEAAGVLLHHGDFFALRDYHLKDVTAVYDRGALVALPNGMRALYAKHSRAIVPQGSVGLLISLEYDQSLMQGPPFSVPEEEVRKLYSQCQSVEVLERLDVIEANAKFRERGLSSLSEVVYKIVF